MAVMLPFYESCNQPFGIYVAGWSGGAMVLGKFQVSGRPTIKMIVRQGPAALAVGAGGSCFGHLYSPLSLPSSGRRPDID